MFNFVKTYQLLVYVLDNGEPYDYLGILLDDIFLEEVCRMYLR